MKKALIVSVITMTIGNFCYNFSMAAVIDADWKSPGDGLAILDTNSNMEWLDLTETANLTVDYVTGELGLGGEFEGWRLATDLEVRELLFSAGFRYLNQWHTDNLLLVEELFEIWGELGVDPGYQIRQSYFAVKHTTGEKTYANYKAGSIIAGSSLWHPGKGWAGDGAYYSSYHDHQDPLFGVALTRVPEPTTLLLLGMGGVLMRKRK